MDVEFLVQVYQLKHGRELPQVRLTNTWDALQALKAAQLLSAQDYAVLHAGYDFLRLVEAGRWATREAINVGLLP